MDISYVSRKNSGKITEQTRVLKSLLIILLLSSGLQAWSQFDYQFWMPPIWETGVSDQNSPSELFITTPYSSSVGVHVETPDGTTFVYNGTVTSGAPLSIPLSATLGQTNIPNQVITNNGFIITSTAPIQCIHKVSAEFNQTLITLKGKNGRGKDFWCGSQVRNNSSSYGSNEFHFISVMAMEDNTSISIATPYNMFLAGPGDLANPYNITLNKNQCYLIRSNVTNQHVTGAHVTSNKDIVVISGSTHTRISGSGADAADGGTDQLVPVPLIGTSYAVIKGNNNNPYDYAIVVATQNSTKVFIDGSGSPSATINAGQYFDWTLTGSFGAPHSIRTDKPSYVYHVSGTSQDDEVDMSIMPQLQCTGSRYIEFSKFTSNTSQQIMQLLVSPAAESTLKVNNVFYQSVPGVIYNNIPGLPGWKSVTLPTNSLSNNNIVKSNGFFHAGWLTGNAGKTGAYGYLSGFDDAFEFLDPTSNLPTNIYQLGPLCQGQSMDHCLKVVSCAGDNEITSYSGNLGTIVLAPPSSPYDSCFRYTAPANFAGYDTVNFIVTNSFGFQSSIDIVFKVVKPNTPINAGPDQTLCSVNTTTLSAVNPDPLANGYWTVAQGTGVIVTPNSPTTSVTGLSPGVNTFIWHQDYPSCAVNNVDLVQVFVFSGTPPNANAGPDASLCSGTTYTMQANNPGFTGQGTWEILSGNATISNINSANALVTNLAIGVNTFRWNISNGGCPGGETNDVMIIYVYNQNHQAANAGSDQTACQGSFSSIAIAGNAPQVPATGQWSVVSGSGNFANANASSTSVSGLTIGTNVFRWTISNGPCGTLTDDVQITVFNPASPAANAGPDQSICLPTNSATLAGNSPISPATGLWTVVQGTGSFANANLPNTSVSGLTLGTNRFRWTLNNGPCANPITFDEIIITVYPASQPAIDAGPNQQLCFSGSPLTATLSGSSITAPGTGLWTVVTGSGTFASPTLPSTTVSGMSIGNNVFQWTVTNGSCGSPQSDQVTITIFNNGIAPANAGPDAQLCTPSTSYTMQGVAPSLPATGVWTLIAGSGAITTPSSPTSTITNLGVGNNVFRWTINNGACGGSNFDEVTISVFNNSAAAANAGTDREFCFDGVTPVTATMAANAATAPGIGTWTLVSGGGTIISPNTPTTNITSLPVGINIFQWTINNGACGTTSDQVVITVYNPNQTAANAGPDQQICSTTPSVSLSANTLLSPATGIWTVVSGTGVFSNATSPSTSVTGMSLGNNVYQWTINNGPCSTPAMLSDQVVITVFNSNQAAANAGPDQSICSTTTSITLAGNTATLPATGLWTVIAGSGTFSNASSPTSSVTGMSIGTNIYQWTITNSSCGSPTMDQMTVTVFSSTAPTANAGADQPFCTPTSSTNFAGNTPLFPSTGQWTLISGSGTIANPASPTSLVSGLGIGANTFQWTINNGSCGTITSDQVTFTLFDSGQAGPDAGPDASLCTPQSTYVMQAAAVASPALGTWSLISGTGTISNPNNSSATISGLGVGTNVFRWTISNGPCPVGASFDEMTIFVFNANQLTANAGADKSLCYDGVNPVNTTMSGSAVIAPGSGVWTLIQGGGTITTPASPTTTITNLPVGHNIFRWTVSNGACTPPSSFDEISIWVYRGTQPAADAGADQQLCSTTISTTLAGNNVTFPATGLWTVVQGTANFANASNPTTTITGLSLGTNILQWTISNGPCSPPTTSDQVTIIVYNNAQPAANAGIDKNICSNITSIAMTGNTATSPATGLWTVVSGTGVFSNATSPVSTVTGMSIGTNIYQWTISNGVCGSPTSDQVTVTVYNVNAPIANAGADQSFCLPTTATVFAGNTPFSPATGLWTLISGSGTITTPTSANSAVTGLGVGSNTFRWTINNGACNSITSDDVTILIFDSGQSGPSAGPDVSLCTPQSTYVMQANSVTFPAVGTWSLVSGAGSISNVNNPTATISGLGVGTSVFRWTITNGPCPAGSNFDDIIISVYDANQPPANAGPDQSFCYGGVSPVNAVMNASITTAPGAGTWTLISGGGTIGSVNSPTTSITNLPVGTNIFRWTVSNGPCAPPTSFDEVSIFVFPGNQAPANAGSDQQLCSTNPNTVLAGNPYVAPATGVWTVVLGSATFANASNPLTAVTNLGVGTNVLQWTISNGSCVPSVTSDQVTITVFNNAQTSANAGSDISICSTQPAVTLTGTPFTAPATALWTLVSGAGTIASPSNSSTSVSNLGVGLNIFEYTISNGPCAAPTSDQITVTVFSSTQSVANAGPDQSICLPQTTTMLAGNVPIFPATGTWTRLSGSGTITNPSNAGSTVTGLAVGLNSFQWTISNGPCSPPATSDIVNIYIYDNTQPVANAGPDVSFCTPTSTYIMQANSAIFPAQGTWTLISGTATIANVNNPVSNISGLGIGTNVFRWTMNNGPCPGGTTFDDMTIFVYDQNQLPANAGPDQSFCFDGVSPVNATMSASAVISPGSGTWTLVQGSGNIVFPNSPITAVTNLAVGENIFRWTVSNGPCVPSNTNDLVSIFVYPGNQAPANAGPDQQLCSNNPVTTLAGNAAVFPASGLWTIVQGSATFADVSSPTTGVSNLGIGTNILRWTIINGPCVPGSTFDEVSITVFNNAQAPANAGADQSICSVQTSVTVSGTTTSLPATALWTLVSGTGTINSPTSNSTTITGLSIGLNVFEYTVSNGPCAAPTTDQVVITVYPGSQPSAMAGPDQSICLPTTSVTLAGNSPTFPATGTWTLVSGSGSITNPGTSNSSVTGLAVGQNVFQWTISNGPCIPSTTSDQVSIFVYDNTQPAANAGADKNFCEPVSSATLAANPVIFPATGQWTLISGTGSIFNPNSATTQVNGLSQGENIFQWTISNGPCPGSTTTDQISIFIYDKDQMPANAGTDQFLCTPASTATMSANSATFPATGAWTLISGSGIISTPTSPTTGITGLAIGENIFRWTITNGPCSNSITTDDISIFVYDSGAPAADAGPTQSICSPANSVTMVANAAVFPGIGTWELVSGTGIIQSPNSPSSLITNLGLGENVFRWTVNNGLCGSATTQSLVSIFVYSEFSPSAVAGIDQDLCTPQVNTFLQGSTPIFPSTGLWTLLSGVGTIVDPTNPNTEVTNLGIGPNVFRWTVLNGPCANGTTSDDVTITIYNGGAAAPFAGNDQELCSPTSSTLLVADPAEFPGVGTWSVINGTGTFSDPNDPSATVTGLSIGINILKWNVNYSTCGSPSDVVSIIVYDSSQGASDAGQDQFLCNNVASTTMTAEPVIAPGSGTWSLISGSAAIADVNNPSSGIGNLAVGANVFVWTIYNGNCLSPTLTTDTVVIYVFDGNVLPANAGADQSFCSPVSSATVTGNTLTYPQTGLWELIQGTGVIVNPTSATTVITGLSVGENIFRWTTDNGPCLNSITSDLVSIFIYDQNQLPANAGSDQSFCTPVSTTTMQGNTITFPAIGTWTLHSGTGVIADPNNPSSSVSGLSIGENIFQWQVENGPCGSPTTDIVSIFIYDENNPLADAGSDQEMCLPQNSTSMQGSTYVFPATGTWTLIQGFATIQNINDPNSGITNLGAGENIFVWTISNGPCAHTPTTDTIAIRVYEPDAAPADAGADQSLCTPSSQAVMTAAVPDNPGFGTWTIVSGAAIIVDPNDPNTLITGLQQGETVLEWTVYNGPCNNSNTTDLISIFIYDNTQPAANAGPDQDLCTPVTSTIISANSPIFPAIGYWTLISGQGDISDPNNPTTTVSNLGVGANVFQWTIENGPCDPQLTTDDLVIYLFDNTQSAANAGVDQEFCLPVTNATLEGSHLVGASTGMWTVFSGGGTIVAPDQEQTLVTDLPVGENIFVWEVNNGSCGTTTDTTSIFIFDPSAAEADAGSDTSFCTPVSTYPMLANTPAAPGVGTWQLVSGNGTIAEFHSATSDISGLTIGENIFTWSIYNGPCEPPTIDSVSIFIFDENLLPADAGSDQEICLPLNMVTMTANVPVFPATGTWTLFSGTGTITDVSDPATTITNLTAGENIFVWTFENGPCAESVTTDTVSITVYDPDALIADAGADQSLCTPAGSTFLSAATPTIPGLGTWSVIAGTGVFVNPNDPNSEVTGLSVGQNIFEWIVYNGPCAVTNTTDQVSIFLYDANQQDADAGPNQDFCTPITTAQMSANSIIFPASGTWTISQGAGSIVNPNDPTTLVTDLAPGVNILTWTVNNGPCANGITTDTVELSIFNNDQSDANAGADQELCLPVNSTLLQSNQLTGAATGTWTLFSGGGDIADANSEITAVTNLPVGINVFVWTQENGPCGSTSDTVSVSVFDPGAAVADAGPDVSFCTPTSTYTMAANTPAIPGVGTWALVSGTGSIAFVNSPSTIISGLTIGENVFSWTIYNGPCAQPTVDFVSIFIFDENLPEANAGSDQEICLPQNSTTMTANTPVFPAEGQWTLFSGTGTISDNSDPATSVTGLGVGVNTFVWTFNNGPCNNAITTDTVSILVFDPIAAVADAGGDQYLCTPITATALTATTPDVPGFGTWTVVNGTGIFANVNDPNTTVTNLSVGENIFRWVVYNGPCSVTNTEDLVSVFVFDANQSVADAGPDQDFCTPVSVVQLDGNELTFPAAGYWSVVQGSVVFNDTSDPNTIITNVTPGVNILAWTVDNGVCPNGTTTDNVVISIFDANQSPADAGADQELCLPATSALLQANPLIAAATGQWTLIAGGGTIVDPTNESTTVSNLPVGINTFVWTLNNGPCSTTADTVSVIVFDPAAPAANAGSDVSYCTPVSIHTMAANFPAIPGTGTWALISGTGSLSDVNSATAVVSGLTVGQNIFSWTIYNGPCAAPTVDLVSIFIYDQNMPSANAGADQELCAPASTTTMTGNSPVFPGTGQWSLVAGTGIIADPSSPSSAVSGLSIGTNVFVWSFDNGPCPGAITTDTMEVRIYDPNAPAANAGIDQFLCTPTSSTALTALVPTIPGVGTWVVVNGTGTFADIHDPSTVVTNLSVGQNTFQWTVYNGPCANTNTTDLVSIFLYDATQATSNAGPDQQLCTPNTTTQLAGNSIIFPATGTWSIAQGSATFSDINDPNAVISNVAPGVNIFTWTVNNGPCANNITTDNVTVSVYNNNQSIADAGSDQELCLPTTGTTLQANQLTAAATGIWSLLSGGGTIADPTSEFTAISNLPVGINVFVWSLDNGPCGISSDTVSVAVYDPASPPANAGEDAFYCTPVSTHTMSGSVPLYPAEGTWTLITGSGIIQDIHDPNSLITGLTVGENIFIWSVYNGPCGPVTLDVMSIFIYNENTPNADAGEDFEICLPQNSVDMMASPAEFPAIGVWTLVQGGGTINDVNSPNSTMANLPVGTNIFIWTVDNGPCANGITSDTVEVRVFDPGIALPNAGPDQNICTPASTTVMGAEQVNDPNFGTWELIGGSGVIGNVNDPGTIISGLAVGVNTFTWTVYNGSCENSLMTDTMVINVFDEGQLPADAGADQELCFPQTSTQLSANHAIVPAEGTWIVIEGSGIFADIHDENTMVSGLSIGNNTFQWTIDNGPCMNAVTTDLVTISIFDPEAVNAQAGADMEICTPQDCVQMGATTPADPQIGTWSVVSAINGNGAIPFGSFNDVNDPNAQLCALSVGVHTLQWELYNGPCLNNTTDIVIVSVFDETAPPANAGTDQELCGGNNQTQLTANTPVFPAVGTWNILSAPGNPVIADTNDPLSPITNLQIGITTLTWSIYNGPCNEATSDTVVVVVFDPQSPDANAGPDQNFCENFPDTPMAANTPIYPAVGTWTTISGGGTFSNPNDPSAMVSDIPLNENIYVWTIYNGACNNGVTSDTISVYVNDLTVAAANAGDDVVFCGAPDSLQLHGSVTTGLATSLWTIIQGGGDIQNVLNNNPYMFEIPNGINIYEYTVDNGLCGISSDEVIVTIYDPELPSADAGTGDMICENEFTSFNLMANAVSPPAMGWWSVLEGPIEISDSTDAKAIVTSLGHILTELVNVPSTLVWTIDNGTCGSSSDSVTYILEDCLSIKIPDAFSPNGDGVNDFWIIPNITNYPHNSVKIFNRWGAEVYSAAPYKNEWDGISIHPATLGEGLPVSTYYYILDLGTGSSENYTGFVYLKR